LIDSESLIEYIYLKSG